MKRQNLPDALFAAYDWTQAADELDELRGLRGKELEAYCRDSAANYANLPDGDEWAHDAVSADDLRNLHHWLQRAPWTYGGYWNAVMGAHRDATDVVREFGLTLAGLDEWLGRAESEAWGEGRSDRHAEMPEEWRGFHTRAVAEIEHAIEVFYGS